MIAPLAKFLDWSAVQATTLLLPANFYRNNPRLEDALEFLNAPELLSGESRPAQVEFNGLRNFHFPTPRPSEFTENNVVHGRFYPCIERWQERPMTILLHGSGDSLNYNLDFLCPKDDLEDLWRLWGQPDIWRLPHGHVGICCGLMPGLNSRVLDWLEPRLNGDTVQTLNK